MADPGQGLAAVVSLGDSFIAGEGGRFAGQADNAATDRGLNVYRFNNDDTVNFIENGWSHEGGCHRSDSAPIYGAPSTTFRRFNLACSGASAVNVWRSASGGQS